MASAVGVARQECGECAGQVGPAVQAVVRGGCGKDLRDLLAGVCVLEGLEIGKRVALGGQELAGSCAVRAGEPLVGGYTRKADQRIDHRVSAGLP